MIAVLSARVEEIAENQKNFITKEDAKKFATKEDLKRFATKEDLKKFATKKDLKQYATKGDLKEDLKSMAFTVFNGISDPFMTLEERTNAHERRLSTLERSFWEIVKKKQARGEMTWLELPHSISPKTPKESGV